MRPARSAAAGAVLTPKACRRKTVNTTSIAFALRRSARAIIPIQTSPINWHHREVLTIYLFSIIEKRRTISEIYDYVYGVKLCAVGK